jgi:hypothetical protein
MVEGMSELPQAATIDNVRENAQRLLAVDSSIAELKAALKTAEAESLHLRITVLPRMMQELQLTVLGVGNRLVKIAPKVYASLPKDPEKREKAVDWLHKSGYGGIVKRALVVSPMPDDLAINEEVTEELKGHGLSPTMDYNIHHSTYSATAREIVTGGKAYPEDVMGIHVVIEASVE